MNRRDFLKLLALLPAVFRMEIPMATNGQLIRKLAGGQQLSEAEIQQLERAMDGYDNYSGIVRDNTVMGSRELNIPTTFNVVYSTILDTDVASIEVNIGGEYRHLMIVGSGRTDSSSGYVEGAMIQFNNDTDSNYMHTGEGRLNNTTSGYQNTSFTSAIIGSFNTANAISNSVGGFFSFIQNINGGFWKAFSTIYGASNAGASASLYTQVNFGVWKSTDKVTSIKLLTETGSNIIAGSIFSVYGIL